MTGRDHHPSAEKERGTHIRKKGRFDFASLVARRLVVQTSKKVGLSALILMAVFVGSLDPGWASEFDSRTVTLHDDSHFSGIRRITVPSSSCSPSATYKSGGHTCYRLSGCSKNLDGKVSSLKVRWFGPEAVKPKH